MARRRRRRCSRGLSSPPQQEGFLTLGAGTPDVAFDGAATRSWRRRSSSDGGGAPIVQVTTRPPIARCPRQHHRDDDPIRLRGRRRPAGRARRERTATLGVHIRRSPHHGREPPHGGTFTSRPSCRRTNNGHRGPRSARPGARSWPEDGATTPGQDAATGRHHFSPPTTSDWDEPIPRRRWRSTTRARLSSRGSSPMGRT